MTVCIAARCIENYIFCASDRMLTAGDVQYEPPSPKTFQLSKHVVSMMSGDAAFYTEIMDAVFRSLNENSRSVVPVRDVVDMFIDRRTEAKRKRASKSILGPLGLSSEEFLSRQLEMDTGLVDKLATELVNYYVPEVDVIVAGYDADGPQIFTISDGDSSCNNAIGFACVGSGSRHAESRFMHAKHAWNSPFAETLFLTYVAKKKSEIAPGVGRGTDIFMIHPDDNGVTLVNEDVIKKLEKTYEKLARNEEKQFEAASKEVRTYVASITQKAAEEAQKQAENAASKPAPAYDSSGDAKK